MVEPSAVPLCVIAVATVAGIVALVWLSNRDDSRGG